MAAFLYVFTEYIFKFLQSNSPLQLFNFIQ